MIKPSHYQIENLLIHPFRPEDLEKFEKLTMDVFTILSNDHTLTFIPNNGIKRSYTKIFSSSGYPLTYLMITTHPDVAFVPLPVRMV
ncbi:MAG: hypothetical protein J7577_12290 [Sphingobacteriaceae bacterium]|nr:hypothetical protein [Sphingobacteriaceae bacterium]